MNSKGRMSKNKLDQPTKDELDQLSAKLRDMGENNWRTLLEATGFKPDELTPEEEAFDKRGALDTLIYIPEKPLQEQYALFQENDQKRSKWPNIISRPKTDPGRVQSEPKNTQRNNEKPE